MRALLALLLVAVVFGPGAVAEEVTEEEPLQPLDHGADDNHDSPGVGVLALAGVAGAAAVLRRRS